MRKALSVSLPFILALACSRQEPPAPSSPRLAQPGVTTPSQAPGYIKPAAEVTATQGPVQLTLRLLSAKVRPGDSVWYQVEIRNVGSKPFYVVRGQTGRHGNPFRELGIGVKDSRGNYPTQNDPFREPHDWAYDIDVKAIGKEEVLKVLLTTSSYSDGPALTQVWLDPGQSVATPAWSARPTKHPPIGQYMEDDRNLLVEPGTYTIWAEYDARIPTEFQKEFGMKPDASNVRVQTPGIRFEVSP